MSLVDLLNENEQTQNGQIHGVAIGVVTDNKDPEKLGRIKLSFPWRGEDDQSEWARVAAPMAGKERGFFFLPEVDDEVLVAFDRGDISQPYVIGSLWNGKDKPPETNSDGKNNIRKIRSRSGHEIIFGDDHENKKEKLEILTKAGHKIVLDDSDGGEKIEIIDKAGSNSICIDSAQNSISIKSDSKISVESQQIDIKSGGMMTIQASGDLTIKGAMVKIN